MHQIGTRNEINAGGRQANAANQVANRTECDKRKKAGIRIKRLYDTERLCYNIGWLFAASLYFI